ncbi:MAG: hypothetical protein RSE41_00345 [Clostridia bacterium]
MKTFNESQWHGTDADLETSLFEYGFVCKKLENSEEYEVLTRKDDLYFTILMISEDDLNEFISDLTESSRKSFLCTVGCEEDYNEWKNLSFVNKLSDIYIYYGLNYFYSSSIDFLKEDKVRTMLDIPIELED